MDRGPWWDTVHGVAKLWTWQNQLSTHAYTPLLQCLLIKELWRDFPGSLGSPDSSVGKEPACSAGDLGLIPGWGKSTGEGLGYPLQYSWASLVAQLVKNPPAMCGTWVRSLGWQEPLGERGSTNLKNIQATPTAQLQKNKWPNQKMGQRTKQTFLQRRHTDS